MNKVTPQHVNRPDLNNNAAALSQQAIETNMMVALRRASGMGNAFAATRTDRPSISDAQDDLDSVAGSFGPISIGGGSDPNLPVEGIASPRANEDWRFASEDRWQIYQDPERAVQGSTPQAAAPATQLPQQQLATVRVDLPTGTAEYGIDQSGVQTNHQFAPPQQDMTGLQYYGNSDGKQFDYTDYNNAPQTTDTAPPQDIGIRPFGLDDIDFS